MQLSHEQLFATKQLLQQQMETLEQQLQELIQKQLQAKKIETLAQLILEYDRIEGEIEDRSKVFSLLSSPVESLRSPFIKAELFSYFVAAETVSPELVDALVSELLVQLRADIQSGEDNTVDLVMAEYKEYIIPGKLIAERFDEVDGLLDEMNRLCSQKDPGYDDDAAFGVLEYAFQRSIDADTRMEPTIQALKNMQFKYMSDESRARLLDHVEERLGILRFEAARMQNIAMDKAILIFNERDSKV